MSLIDADALRKDIVELPNCPNGFSGTYDKATILGVIDDQPTVDAVPVIRCKDCKFYEDYWEKGYCMHRKGLNGKPCADDYCSRAERREE